MDLIELDLDAAPEQHDWVRPHGGDQTVVASGAFGGVTAVGDIGRLAGVTRRLASSKAPGGYRAGTAVDSATVGDLAISAASVRGLSHLDFKKVRQDAFSFDATADGRYLIGVIADGMGSADGSQIGADVVTIRGLDVVRDALEGVDLHGLDWRDCAEQIRLLVRRRGEAVLTAHGRATGGPDGEQYPDVQFAKLLGTTAEFVVVAVEPDSDGLRPFVRVVVAGDGSGFVRDEKRGWFPLGIGKPGGADFASNAMVPLPLPLAPDFPQVQEGRLEPGQAVLITTDGVGQQMGAGGTEVAAYLHAELSEPLPQHDYLRITSFLARQADDDRTVLVIWS